MHRVMYMHHKMTNPTSLQSCACTMLRKASRALTRHYDRALARHGISTVQFAILRNIDRNGAPELSRLAEIMVMDRTSLYRALTPMAKHCWIAIGDARGKAKSVRLLADGHTMLAACDGDWTATQQDVVGGLVSGEWDALQATLAKLAAIDAAPAGRVA